MHLQCFDDIYSKLRFSLSSECPQLSKLPVNQKIELIKIQQIPSAGPASETDSALYHPPFRPSPALLPPFFAAAIASIILAVEARPPLAPRCDCKCDVHITEAKNIIGWRRYTARYAEATPGACGSKPAGQSFLDGIRSENGWGHNWQAWTDDAGVNWWADSETMGVAGLNVIVNGIGNTGFVDCCTDETGVGACPAVTCAFS
ncbi:MAG: hypothetical protein Q9162_000096 [Coniocarpon cinnabarinum]